MKITDTFEGDKLRTGICASSATVGRPTGIEGKNRVPRRARVSAKEKEKLSAGGPGSGRRPGEGSGKTPEFQKDSRNKGNLLYLHNKLISDGYKYKDSSKGADALGKPSIVHRYVATTRPKSDMFDHPRVARLHELKNGNHAIEYGGKNWGR